MSYKKIFAVPNPEGGGVCHFEDFDVALEFARAQGLSAGRILTDYLDEDGNPINPPPDEIERRVEAAKSSAPIDIIKVLGEISDQDKGAPSPVPYSVLLRSPSEDVDPAGREQYQAQIATKTLEQAIAQVAAFCPIDGLEFFIESAFNQGGAYRLEILVGTISIKIYKHPNN